MLSLLKMKKLIKDQTNTIHVVEKPMGGVNHQYDYHSIAYTYNNEVFTLEDNKNIKSEAQYTLLVPTILSPIQTNTKSPSKDVPKEELLEDD